MTRIAAVINKVIAVDFDGVLCGPAQFPEIGAPNTELIEKLLSTREHGCKLILWTCREGNDLERAVQWCSRQGLEFDAVNEGIPERIAQYGDSRKIGADIYIDDRAVSPVPFSDVPFYLLPQVWQSK